MWFYDILAHKNTKFLRGSLFYVCKQKKLSWAIIKAIILRYHIYPREIIRVIFIEERVSKYNPWHELIKQRNLHHIGSR